MPGAGPRTAWGLLAGDPRGLVVRCFDQQGEDQKDFDFSGFVMAAPLRDALVAAFVKRTAPGAGLTSLSSSRNAYLPLARLDLFLATLPSPPAEIAELTPEHLDGFYRHRAHVGSAAAELEQLKMLLGNAEGLSGAVTARLARPMPKKPKAERKESYSKAEIKRIAQAARLDLRAAAARIRRNRALLARARQGEVPAGLDRDTRRRLELLESVDRIADVPRRARPVKRGGHPPVKWLGDFGTVLEVVSWLHLTRAEVAAGAVLLGVMTGENPDVIIKAPALHHRADGYTGGPGTAIVALRKPRRQSRAYMDLALSEVPDWISIPEDLRGLSARDELHTPFGLYMLLHELTSRSRALAGGNRLLVGYGASGGSGVGRGLRPMAAGGMQVSLLGRTHGLTADTPDEDGRPVPLPVRLDLLRLSFIELHQKPVAHTTQTAATQYLLRNRGNLAEYQKVVAGVLETEAAKARTRGKVATMSTPDLERARLDPQAVADEQGIDAQTLERLLDKELDTVMTACTSNNDSPHGAPGQPCPASFMLCLECECARALPHHLPVQVLVLERLAERREQMNALQWAQRFAGPHDRLTDLIDQHDDAAVQDARQAATAADRLLVERFLNRELDLR